MATTIPTALPLETRVEENAMLCLSAGMTLTVFWVSVDLRTAWDSPVRLPSSILMETVLISMRRRSAGTLSPWLIFCVIQIQLEYFDDVSWDEVLGGNVSPVAIAEDKGFNALEVF